MTEGLYLDTFLLSPPAWKKLYSELSGPDEYLRI